MKKMIFQCHDVWNIQDLMAVHILDVDKGSLIFEMESPPSVFLLPHVCLLCSNQKRPKCIFFPLP